MRTFCVVENLDRVELWSLTVMYSTEAYRNYLMSTMWVVEGYMIFKKGIKVILILLFPSLQWKGSHLMSSSTTHFFVMGSWMRD